jgi:dTMP kinase
MLISFEGIDGSGKSTQARLLSDRLMREGRHALLVREPGGTRLSERVRALLLDPDLSIEPFAELLLFSAARAQLVAEQIRPALAAGHTVICDRFFDSTTAYQGAGRELEDAAWIHEFNLRVTNGLVPHRTYLFDIDPDLALARCSERTAAEGSEGTDRMESAERAFHERVAEGYRLLARREPERILVIDGTQSVETLHILVWKDFEARFRVPQHE